MTVTVNGEPRQVDDGLTVARLLETLAVGEVRLAVEVNRAVVRREDHGQHALAEGDRIEIVTFVGGG